VETLELLEELLAGYCGTLLLVSHDREFIDNVVTSTLVLEGNGLVGEYVGGYGDWLRQRQPDRQPEAVKREPEPGKVATASSTPRRKLSYKDARELELLPARIETLENEIAARTAAMHDPAFFKQDGAAITAANQALATFQTELDAAYARWQELEG
jgi:ATP-binding cassette subfamily F protein uup